jgi:hypothetical protein
MDHHHVYSYYGSSLCVESLSIITPDTHRPLTDREVLPLSVLAVSLRKRESARERARERTSEREREREREREERERERERERQREIER